MLPNHPHPHSPDTICRSLERWSSWAHQDIESDKSTVDTVNALVVVSAFIAGVQSTIISLTINLPKSSLGKATNAIAFVGLLLDVIGTFLGVIHAIVLQRRIKENTALLNAMTEISTSLRTTQNLTPDKLTPDQVRDMGILDDPQQQLRRAQQLHEILEDRFKDRVVSASFSVALGVLHALIFPAIGKDKVEMMIKSLFGLGHTPLLAMALGVVGLVVSIIMFAAESTALSYEVWVSCVAVLGGVIVLSLIPISYDKAKNYFFPKDTERLPG